MKFFSEENLPSGQANKCMILTGAGYRISPRKADRNGLVLGHVFDILLSWVSE